MILGVEKHERKGREKNKWFLYDIVNNTAHGLDVDKLDYLQRDRAATHATTPNLSFDRYGDYFSCTNNAIILRFIQLARVLPARIRDEDDPILTVRTLIHPFCTYTS
jgi:HD superfamily phosphohydrolase